MANIADLFDLRAGWNVRPESLADAAGRLRRMLESLGTLHPAFRAIDWQVKGTVAPRRAPPLDALAPLFLPQDDDDPAQRPRASNGYRVSGTWDGAAARAISVDMRVGCNGEYPSQPWFPNYLSLVINTRDDGHDDAPILAALLPALRTIVTAWEPRWAGIASTKLRNIATSAGEPFSFFRGMYAVYLERDSADAIAVPTQIASERLGDGLLLKVTDAPFTPDEETQLLGAVMLRYMLAPLLDPEEPEEVQE